MPEWLGWTLGIAVFLLAITVSVGLHEAGHMTVARAFKIPVPKFFVGFGPTLWSAKRGDTEYGVKAIPLGGFVQIEDDTQPEDSVERGMLSFVNPWKRLAIFAAGPLVNIILGTAIIVTMLVVTPMRVVSTTVNTVDSCSQGVNCGAERGGVQPGDRIIEVDGVPIHSIQDMAANFKESGSTVVVERGDERVTLHVVANEKGKIGVNMLQVDHRRSLGEAFASVGSLLWMNLNGLIEVPGKLPNILSAILGHEERSPDSVSSMIAVGKVYGETTASEDLAPASKLYTLVMYTGLLNYGLGFANLLLPFLPLDGGRMLVAFMDLLRQGWARLRRKAYTPTEYKFIHSMTIVTGSFLLVFMVLVMVADIVAPISTQ